MSRHNAAGGHAASPWQARVKRQGVSYYLGHFATKAEADEAERSFRKRRGWEVPAPRRPHLAERHGRLVEIGFR